MRENFDRYFSLTIARWLTHVYDADNPAESSTTPGDVTLFLFPVWRCGTCGVHPPSLAREGRFSKEHPSSPRPSSHSHRLHEKYSVGNHTRHEHTDGLTQHGSLYAGKSS